MVLLQGEPTEAFEWFKVEREIGNVRNQSQNLIKARRPRRLRTEPSFKIMQNQSRDDSDHTESVYKQYNKMSTEIEFRFVQLAHPVALI